MIGYFTRRRCRCFRKRARAACGVCAGGGNGPPSGQRPDTARTAQSHVRQRERREAHGEVEDDLVVICRHGCDTHLPVFVLRTKTLERPPAGDAAQPGECIGERGSTKLQDDPHPTPRRFGCQGDLKIERAWVEIGKDSNPFSSEPTFQCRWRDFDPACVRVRAKLSADGEVLNAFAGWNEQAPAIANPGGIDGEGVKKQAGITRGAPCAAAGGRWT